MYHPAVSRKLPPLFAKLNLGRAPRKVYEPDLCSEAGAREFLDYLKGITKPPERRPFRDLIALDGFQYYAVYTTLTAITLVFVIFPMLSALGPAGGYDTAWVHPSAIMLLNCLSTAAALYLIWSCAYGWLLGGRLPVPGDGTPAPAGDPPGEGPAGETIEAVLKQCGLELKSLSDRLSDRVAVLNQVLSLCAPVLFVIHVVTTPLSGSNPMRDATPLSVVTYAITLVIGTLAAVLFLPLRLLAHGRLTKYREWLKRTEEALLKL